MEISSVLLWDFSLSCKGLVQLVPVQDSSRTGRHTGHCTVKPWRTTIGAVTRMQGAHAGESIIDPGVANSKSQICCVCA